MQVQYMHTPRGVQGTNCKFYILTKKNASIKHTEHIGVNQKKERTEGKRKKEEGKKKSKEPRVNIECECKHLGNMQFTAPRQLKKKQTAPHPYTFPVKRIFSS